MSEDAKNAFSGLGKRPDTFEVREEAESRAKGLVDGRTLRRKNRPEQVAYKTSLEIKKLIQQLAQERGTTITEVIETAVQRLAAEDEAK
jgi:hypothetical protein